MASIRVGDSVYGPNGEANRVVAKSEVAHNETCYRVTFDDGAELIAHDQHQWAIETYTMRKSRGNGRWNVPKYKILTTEQLRERVGRVKYLDSIMLTQPVQMPIQKQSLDPYIYGLWLGDGNTSGGQLTAEHADCATYAEYFEAAGLDLACIDEDKYRYRSYELHRLLRELGCVGNKSFIPDEYRLGSVEQRLALLQGLMDTDGTVSNEQLQFDNSNRDLVELVAWLVNSLGGKGRYYSHEPYYVKNGERVYGKTSYRFGFNIALPVFRLRRKLDKQMLLKQGPQTVRRYIKKIESVESVPMQCIQVEDQDGLYLAGSEFIVTHNSTMAARDLEPKLFLPNKQYWIVAPTYDLGEKEFRVVWNDLIIKLGLGKDKSIRRVYNKKQGNMVIEFPWQTRLEVRSADHPENLVGEALDGVIMSEAAKHKKETWEQFIRPSLADKRGFADFPTTPEGYNWYYDLWMLGKDPEFVDYQSWRFPTWANSALFPLGERDPEIVMLKRTMSRASFDQEIAADFGSFVGKIYEDWDATENVKKVEFNPNWPNYIAFDWGFTNPLAAIEFQVSPDDRIYIWREHYRAYTRLEKHLEIMRDREQPEGYRIDLCFGDAADPEAVMTVNQKFAPCIALPEAKTNWRMGIDRVSGFMLREEGEDEYGGPIYERAFFVDFSCVNTIKEFNNYKAPESVKGKNVQEIGLRQDDHALDAIRYGLVHIFDLGANTHFAGVNDYDYSTSLNPFHKVSEFASAVGKAAGYHGPSELADISDDRGYFTNVGSF